MPALSHLPARHGQAVNVIVESPKGSSAKFKYDLNVEVIVLSRPLPAGTTYPHDWGFIPSTRASDGDPLDAMVLWDGVSYPGIVIPCRLLGALQVEQKSLETGARERNDRVVAVPMKAPDLEDLRTIFDVTDRRRAELERFFVNVVAFEGKDLKILGWSGPDEAEALLDEALSTTSARR